MLDQVLLVLGWIGAAQAGLLGAALLVRRAAAPADRWLGAGFVAAATACALISLSRDGALASGLEAAEVVATLAAGPLFAGWIARLVGFDVPRWARLAAFAPAALWAVAALARLPFSGDPLAIRPAVVLLMVWSGAAVALAAARWRRLGARTRRAVTLGVGGLALLHVAQAVRLAAPESTPPHLVSATLGLLLVAISFSALSTSRLPVSLGATTPIADDAAAGLVAAFDRLIVEGRGFVEPGLTVGAVARRIGTTAAALSLALNRHAGTTFSERIAQVRTEEAKALLADPKLGHLSVEAIGGRAGFGSRSAFFAEFRRRVGRSPADFRQAAGERAPAAAASPGDRPGSATPRTS